MTQLPNKNANNSCRLAYYRQAMAQAEHSSQASTEPSIPELTDGLPCDGVHTGQSTSQELEEALPAIVPSGEHFGNPQIAEEPTELKGSCEEEACDLGAINEANHECSAGNTCRLRRGTRGSIHRRDSRQLPRRQSTSNGSNSPTVEEYEGHNSDKESPIDNATLSHEQRMAKWRLLELNDYETPLLDCIVNTDAIRPHYEDIFIDKSTIRKLEEVTTMSLKKLKAFGSGILRNNRVTGAVLYGPPGTGKSLLARGTAKQSGFNMLAVSTAEIWQTCWGEDEKVIKAVFSLARKIYPCIVFIDEADAMFGARKGGEKRHVRAMVNQFLMEWDGIQTGNDSPFILLATNRPFDLDPAVLRRAPSHIHLDIPTIEERRGILNLLLRDEELARNINASILATLTPSYTGSDLKNLCVIAAVTCVGEQSEDTARRVLTRQHFMLAMKSIRPTGLSKTLLNEFQNFEKKGRHEDTRYKEG